MTPEATARAYYDAIDAGEYDALAALLATEFVHDRPDRTLSGRESFVRFMREERPRTDTDHVVDAVYGRSSDGRDGDAGDEAAADDDAAGRADAELAVRGRLCGADGETLFGFVDVFRVEPATRRESGTRLARLTTYTD